MLKRGLIATCVMIAASASYAGDEEKAKTIASLLETIGLKQTNNIIGGTCKIVTDADQVEIVKGVPVLQKFSLLNDEMSKNELMRTPTKTTFVIALQLAPVQIKSLYENNQSIDKCNFTHNIISQDEYGNSRKDVLFTYIFDRATYNKINWDKF